MLMEHKSIEVLVLILKYIFFNVKLQLAGFFVSYSAIRKISFSAEMVE